MGPKLTHHCTLARQVSPFKYTLSLPCKDCGKREGETARPLLPGSTAALFLLSSQIPPSAYSSGIPLSSLEKAPTGPTVTSTHRGKGVRKEKSQESQRHGLQEATTEFCICPSELCVKYKYQGLPVLCVQL
jgi:hypothetical protein